AQRIRLATQIGSNLSGVMYVLDEPSIGLHQRDNDRLIASLKKMRDLGNTLIVVEHDEDTMRAADYLIDIGPGAGENGGQVIAAGTPKQVEKKRNSLTGQYLSGKKYIAIPSERRKGNGKKIVVKGAS
ncbi:excinuclease ABC subunit UvrA, partial [Lactobacillus salivarius]|nr:excinuclease ABC subunit UvrA [Ligilactobacillus salivarius]